MPGKGGRSDDRALQEMRGFEAGERSGIRRLKGDDRMKNLDSCDTAEPIVSDKMLATAMKKAVELGVFPKYTGERQYIENWENMQNILEAALLAK